MKRAITRLVVLAVLLVNQVLVTIGWEPLPFDEDAIYEGVSSVATVFVALWTWWKNNNVTEEAQHADNYMQSMKNQKKGKQVE